MEKENEKAKNKSMIVFEKNQPGNYIDYEETQFNAITGNSKPTIEIRFDRTQFGEFVYQMGAGDNEGMAGVLLIKSVEPELYFQPCGNEKFMRKARDVADKMKLAVLE